MLRRFVGRFIYSAGGGRSNRAWQGGLGRVKWVRSDPLPKGA